MIQPFAKKPTRQQIELEQARRKVIEYFYGRMQELEGQAGGQSFIENIRTALESLGKAQDPKALAASIIQEAENGRN